MKKTLLITALFLNFSVIGFSQAKDIPVKNLPKDVENVLNEYLKILNTSENLDECAEKLVNIAGGSLVNEDGSLRNSVKPYSLKKDFQNAGFYSYPAKIARVNLSKTMQTGYGPTALAGDKYKIYIKKKNSGGIPAPIHIVVPKNHEFIKSPKVTNIGSL